MDTPEDTTETRRILYFSFIGLSALIFFSYGASLSFGFLVNSDDQAYVFRNPYLQDLSPANLIAIFTHVHFDSYLPMTLASYSLDYTLWKFHSFGYHLTQLALHLANSFLLLVILLLSRFPTTVALGTAFIYSVHPVHVESVAWIAERKNLLSTFFIFLSLICYIRYGQKASWTYYAAALFFFILALLSKSIAVILPLIFILHDLCLAGRGWRWGEKILFFIGSLAIAGVTVLTQGAVGAIKEYPGGNLPATALFMLRVYWDYVASMAWPFSLSPEYHYIKADFWKWLSLLAYLVVPATIVLAVVRHRTLPVYAFLVGWFFLWFLPVSNIIPLATIRQDRYLYLPSIAVALLFSQAVMTGSRLRPKYGLAVIGVVVLLLAGLTHRYANTYASDRAVRQRIADTYPRWSDAQFELGYQCWLEKDLDCTIRSYRKALETDPNHVQALINMGAILIEQGDYHQARGLLDKARVAAPDSALIYHNLAVIAGKTGEHTGNISQWLKKAEELKSLETKKDYRLGAFRIDP